MGDESVRLSREELYELVWSRPLSRLAEEFAVSGVGLAKVCDRMEVPRPPRGFWAARRLGKRSQERPALGEPRESAPTEIRLARRTEGDQIETAKEPVPEVTVPHSLRDPHPLVARTARALDRARPDYNGIVSPVGDRVLAIDVSGEQRRRALHLLDSLIKAMEKRGHSVRAGPDAKPQTVFEIGGQEISLSLKQRLDRSEHQLTKEEEKRKARAGWSSARPYAYKHSGQLRLRVGSLEGSGVRHTWSDGRRASLEEKLGQVVLEIGAAAAFERERQQRWAAQRAEWEAKWQAQEQDRARQEEERKRIAELRTMADDWASAARVRDFIRAVKESASEPKDSDDLQAWLEWARAAADKIDPLIRGPE